MADPRIVQSVLGWLSERLEDGCTDTTISRFIDRWQITFRNAGIPASDPLGTEHYTGATLFAALEAARTATEVRRNA